jgi:hypothetical protein
MRDLPALGTPRLSCMSEGQHQLLPVLLLRRLVRVRLRGSRVLVLFRLLVRVLPVLVVLLLLNRSRTCLLAESRSLRSK